MTLVLDIGTSNKSTLFDPFITLIGHRSQQQKIASEKSRWIHVEILERQKEMAMRHGKDNVEHLYLV